MERLLVLLLFTELVLELLRLLRVDDELLLRMELAELVDFVLELTELMELEVTELDETLDGELSEL